MGILSGALFIKAFSLWLNIQQSDEATKKKDDSKSEKKTETSKDEIKQKSDQFKVRLCEISLMFIAFHVIGYVLMCCPQMLSDIGKKWYFTNY